MDTDHNGSAGKRTAGSIDEEHLIERIRRKFSAPPSPDLGIGDDAAILHGESPLVITTDLLLENVDFPPETPLWFVGRKALAANLSDLAAMGAEPETFLLTLGLPDRAMSQIDELIDGLSDKAHRFRLTLAGGDLSSSDRVLVSITAIGRVRNGRPLLRSSARPGESLFVSRPLGGASAGLELLSKGWRLSRSSVGSAPAGTSYELRELGTSLLRAQLDPDPEVVLGMALRGFPEIGACIDLSDGLSRDLSRICRASEVGATVDWERLPLVPDLDRLGARLGIDPARCALHGGEEFSLLFSARAGEGELSSRAGRPVYRIGTIDPEPGVRLHRGGRIEPLPIEGFDHFTGRG